MLRVEHLQRRSRRANYSMERLFDDVRAAFGPEIGVTVHINRNLSNGILPRLADAWRARRHRGRVRHILGDVHYLAWFLPRRGTVMTIHDCVSLERLRGAKRWLFWFLWYWLPLQRCERVTVVSTYTRDSLLRWVRFPAERVHVIPPPLSPEFSSHPRSAENKRFRLLQVGTGSNKNLRRVISAIEVLDVELAIIGPLDTETTRLLENSSLQSQQFADLSREEVLHQYQRADALIFVSTYEGFGMPIIEAQAVARPVITSNLCSMPEAAGGAALLVDPFDVEAIRTAVVRLMEEPLLRERLVADGLRNIQKYSPRQIAKAYEDVYRLLGSEGRSTGPAG